MSRQPTRDEIADYLTEAGSDRLPGHMGLEIVELGEGTARLRCEIQPYHTAPNGYLHAASIIALADTAAGYGCVANFPEGAEGFTTIELKTNFLGTLLDGVMVADAVMAHGGRNTQVWDAIVTAEATGKTIGLFRCTQMILYPRDRSDGTPRAQVS